MADLPSNAVLAKLHFSGLSDAQIAKRYGVTRQAVNKRLGLMEISSMPEHRAKAHALVPWDVKTVQYGGGSHHTAYPLEGLKMYLRRLMGDPSLSKRQEADAGRFERKLLKNPGLVLDYDRDSEAGFYWRERTPQDGTLIIAWPLDKEKPAEDLELLEMPSGEKEVQAVPQ
ncbi:hypothetical protein [Streptomyces sp. NPDC058861]|uniref:hypothetical protein n=1 Tax=Streptomyces sp. NPDC058861 TaxID=3346653 RepID=UPI003680C598